jgi:hypothetical protein
LCIQTSDKCCKSAIFFDTKSNRINQPVQEACGYRKLMVETLKKVEINQNLKKLKPIFALLNPA